MKSAQKNKAATELGRRGGLKTFALHGSEHMRLMGLKSIAAYRKRQAVDKSKNKAKISP